MVLDTGGFVEFGTKLFAMPWSMLMIDTYAHEFVLNAPRELLEEAPGFDTNDWPDFSNRDWGLTIHVCDGVPPFWS